MKKLSERFSQSEEEVCLAWSSVLESTLNNEENNILLDECLKELHKIAWDNSDNPTIIKNDVFNVWNKLLDYKINKEKN